MTRFTRFRPGGGAAYACVHVSAASRTAYPGRPPGKPASVSQLRLASQPGSDRSSRLPSAKLRRRLNWG